MNKAIFDSDLKSTRDSKHGYLANFDSFVDDVKSTYELGGGVVELLLGVGDDDKLAVDELWKVVAPIINGQVE